MKAVILDAKPASRDSIREHLTVKDDVPVPEIKSDEVLVKVEATGLNIEDIMIACGWRFGTALTATKENPLILGQEFSGTIEKLGSKVKGWSVGDPVLGHKAPIRVRCGTWAEYVSISAASLVRKPDSYTWAEAAAIPMQCQVAHEPIKVAGFSKLPVLEDLPHKSLTPDMIEVEVDKALITVKGADKDKLKEVKVAVVGASSTTGLMVTDMLVSRGVPVIGVCSAPSAPTVLSNGALAVLDRNQGGVDSRPEGIMLEVIIDCVGGQAVEDASRAALGNKGHFVTAAGPGDGSFGPGIDTVKGLMGHMFGASARSFKSNFVGTKYSLAAMPLSGGTKMMEKLLAEGLKSVVDSEVNMFDQEAMLAAVDKVNSHKTRGRVVFVTS